ncbi:MAG: hypothetical protein R8G66_16005 [Cytophagales bacterium]|nr:hypothetical protein [Cytophagales bacterium]
MLPQKLYASGKVYQFLIASAFIILLLVGVSCKSQKQFSSEDQILFGRGGGFAGQETTYKLQGDGSLMVRKSIQGGFTLAKEGLDRKEIRSIFKGAHRLNWSEIDLNNPGNTYRFLSFNKDGKTYKLTWGGNATAPPKFQYLYDRLYTLAR